MCTAGASEITESMKCKAGHYCPQGTKVEVIMMIRFPFSQKLLFMKFCKPVIVGLHLALV